MRKMMFFSFVLSVIIFLTGCEKPATLQQINENDPFRTNSKAPQLFINGDQDLVRLRVESGDNVTLTWKKKDGYGGPFLIQCSAYPEFDIVIKEYNLYETVKTISHDVDLFYVYYYRITSKKIESDLEWSNVLSIEVEP